MAATGQCAICGNPAEHVGDQYIPAWKCPRCGSAEHHATVGWVPIETAEHRLQLAAWVREQNAAGIEFPNITPEISRVLAHRRLPGLRERADRALAVIARKYPHLKQPTPFEEKAKDTELLGFTYSQNHTDAMVLIEVLLDDGCLHGFKNTVTNQPPDGVITVKGMLAAEALESRPRIHRKDLSLCPSTRV
jgi:hypothetical protein